MIACMTEYHIVSPVESYSLYDGQIIPAHDWRLLLNGF